MTNLNPLFLTDFYKQSHADFYNPKTEVVYSTFTPRKSRMQGVNKVVVFGLQYFVKKYLLQEFNENFFKRDQEEIVSEYLRLMKNTIGDTGIGEQRIRDLHNLGYLPVKICALEEGTLCPMRVPMLTIENTLPEFYWVTNFLETLMCNSLWLPCTSATTSLEYHKILNKWSKKTCDNDEHLKFQAHDFSLRSMSCMEAGAISGLAHLLNFVGTDTIPAIAMAEKYYNADIEKELVSSSIKATEHSVQETNILFNNSTDLAEGEYENLKDILERMGSKATFSYVADTYNLWDFITKVLPRLKDEILNREGKLVVRPDSGNPCDIICGLNTSDYRLSNGTDGKLCTIENDDNVGKILVPIENQKYADERYKGVIELLWDIFGGTINSKGYKVLNPHIGAIYGDSITKERAEEICRRLEQKGFASSNIVFGIGGYSFQYVTRDTFGFALKATYGVVDGKEIQLYKDPITDSGEKKSQKGRVCVYKDKNGELTYTDGMINETSVHENCLLPLFEDGKLLRETSLQEIRDRIKGEI